MMPRLPSNSDPFRRSSTNRIGQIYDSGLSRFQTASRHFTKWYQEQSTTKKVLLQILVVVGFVAVVLAIIFHKYIVIFLIFLADSWSHLQYGRLLLFSLVFAVGFPPLLGFSPLSLLAGMIYGFPNGWPLLAAASVSGSFCSFLVFRYLLHNQAVRLIHSNAAFRAFADILKEDTSLVILILLRLCPLPYSLSNGALAAIPELPAWRFVLASVVTTPKLLIHVFVGYKLKQLGDETKTFATKVVDFISILVTGAASALTTYLIYHRMQTKMAMYQNHPANGGDYDSMIFGNFDDNDLNSTTNVELDSNDFDVDNFVIGDEDDDDEEQRGDAHADAEPERQEEADIVQDRV